MEEDSARRYVSRKTMFALTLLIVLWGPGTPAVMMISGTSHDPFLQAFIFPSFYAAQGIGALLAGAGLSRVHYLKRLIFLSILIDTSCSFLAMMGDFFGGLNVVALLAIQVVSGLANGLRLPMLFLLVRNASQPWEFPRRLAWAGVALVMGESVHWIRILAGPLLGTLQGGFLQEIFEEFDLSDSAMNLMIFFPVVIGTVIRFAAFVPLFLLDMDEFSPPSPQPASVEADVPFQVTAWMMLLRMIIVTVLYLNTLLLYHQRGAQTGVESMYLQLMKGMLIEFVIMLLIYWRGGLRHPLRAFAFCFCCLAIPPLLLATLAGMVPLPAFHGWINAVTLIAAVQWLERRTYQRGWFIPAIGMMVCCENLLSAALMLLQQPVWKWNSTVTSYFLANEVGIPLALAILGIVLSFCWKDPQLQSTQAEPGKA